MRKGGHGGRGSGGVRMGPLPGAAGAWVAAMPTERGGGRSICRQPSSVAASAPEPPVFRMMP